MANNLSTEVMLTLLLSHMLHLCIPGNFGYTDFEKHEEFRVIMVIGKQEKL